mmetsp:Transcript_11538/g.25595  ORF Transcript_11538/g.25595 Transcript_11538/m.25595 type:complete len:433 (-) Transcript_11538:77-1375(-)|eukprot:CAMPEP_0180419652 /NCGR_PEP_ID=MMETSP1036_2-20121128/2215_1 /TAXON_ID=632150 /ORGANISM="Azadinium spinosum, Strain 3D9" /LENGTH=432 /DNA_ID=CAMNT_0022424831 /DNA_START=125 /DNA_END=1423 /DNA_ORIENTATION=+
MGIAHSMNRGQVDEVLTQFEATTVAIRGIETKVDRMRTYVATVQEQRELLIHQAEQGTSILERMTRSLDSKSDEALDFITGTLDNFAGLVEQLELCLYDLGLQDAPRQMQKEFGPLLMPAVVLVVIVTVSNCIFGFLLSTDPDLAKTFTIDNMGQTPSTEAGEEFSAAEDSLSILNIFAIVHVSVIGVAIVYLAIEGFRKLRVGRDGHDPARSENVSVGDAMNARKLHLLSERRKRNSIDSVIPSLRPLHLESDAVAEWSSQELCREAEQPVASESQGWRSEDAEILRSQTPAATVMVVSQAGAEEDSSGSPPAAREDVSPTSASSGRWPSLTSASPQKRKSPSSGRGHGTRQRLRSKDGCSPDDSDRDSQRSKTPVASMLRKLQVVASEYAPPRLGSTGNNANLPSPASDADDINVVAALGGATPTLLKHV